MRALAPENEKPPARLVDCYWFRVKRKYNDFSSVIELILSAFRAIHVKTTKYTWEKINQICLKRA